MEKESEFLLIIKKRFFGIQGELTPEKLNQINRVGNNSFLLLFAYTLFANIMVLIFSVADPKMVLAYFIFANLLFELLVVLGYVSTETMKYNLDVSDNQAQGYYNEIKVIRKRALRLGAIFCVCMWFVERLLDWKFRGVPIHIGVEQLNSYIQAIILGFLYGLILFIYWRARLKRMFNE